MRCRRTGLKVVQEIIRPEEGASFVCYEFSMPEFNHRFHYHHEFEITYVVESEGQRLVGDHMGEFAPGDLVMVGSDIPHVYRNYSAGHTHYFVIQFTLKLLKDALLSVAEAESLRSMFDRGARGLSFSSSTSAKIAPLIRELQALEPSVLKLSRFLEVLHWMSKDEQVQLLASPSFVWTPTPSSLDKCQKVLEYLDEHWDQPISMKEVAAAAHMHPQSLGRFMRQAVGKTCQEYLIWVRLGRASQMILTSSDPISRIAIRCGYENLSNFNRHFKARYGHSPRELRRLQKGP